MNSCLWWWFSLVCKAKCCSTGREGEERERNTEPDHWGSKWLQSCLSWEEKGYMWEQYKQQQREGEGKSSFSWSYGACLRYYWQLLIEFGKSTSYSLFGNGLVEV